MGYGSAEDLPTVQELRTQLKGMRLLGLVFLSKEQRAQMRGIDRQLTEITDTVDRFYDLLGPRHWIFHNDMSMPDMAALVHDNKERPEAAEAALIEWYQDGDRLNSLIRRLSWHDAWRARMGLLKKALDDYKAARYYASVQVLLSVLDGFVNDLDPARRKGLHAYEADDIDAWDSVVGHHAGLSSAHDSFRKVFKARSDELVTELYRNGIVHGMLTNYDNPIVASKAWNRVFAVSDWALSLRNLTAEGTKPPPPTFRQTWDKIAQLSRERTAIDAFEPRRLTSGAEGFLEHDAYVAAVTFLEHWQQSRWGLIPPLLAHMAGQISPRRVKEEYSPLRLEDFRVLEVAEQGAAATHTHVELHINGQMYTPDLRWIFENEHGSLAIPGVSPGAWRLVWWGAPYFLKNKPEESDG